MDGNRTGSIKGWVNTCPYAQFSFNNALLGKGLGQGTKFLADPKSQHLPFSHLESIQEGLVALVF